MFVIKKLHFIVVRAVQYPQNPVDYDGVFMEKACTHAQKFEARAYYVEFCLGKYHGLPLTKEAPLAINYQGLQEISLHG